MMDEQRFIILEGPEEMAGDEYERLAEAVEEALPKDMRALITRGNVETLSKDDLRELLNDD